MNSIRNGEARYVVGIDLGTTNSSVAYVDVESTTPRRISFLEIPQLISPGRLGKRSGLPSFLYLPGPYDVPPGSMSLPWDNKREYCVGELAREQGALVPGRLVSSAKSWLCHDGVDRNGRILPWGMEEDPLKVSPVEASARYLQHIRECWNESLGQQDGCRLEQQTVFLTVPASFDELARELTVKAASQGGLTSVILLEEPLAAFYAWLCRHEKQWQKIMQKDQLILVCDIGGGTTDFTIIAVRQGTKGLRFDRLAVGDHLMLGGDNMDLALARTVECQLRLEGRASLDSRTLHQLWHQCRQAKETLLSTDANGPNAYFDITITGSGSNVIGGMLRGSLDADSVQRIILEGFFPLVSLDDVPHGNRRQGLTEWGLPYVQDPAVTRHLGAFWRRLIPLLQKETGRPSPFPDFILFNGGTLTPQSIRHRLIISLQQWFSPETGLGWVPVELENQHPELAVAEGAAYYGLTRIGEGTRVGAGSPRSYYVEFGGTQRGDKTNAVCLVERGTEEGFEGILTEPAFQVTTNQPVLFQVFSSSTRLGDRMGDIVELQDEEVTGLPPLRTVLRRRKTGAVEMLPVRLDIRLTEIGTLEIWCRARETKNRWQLQFDVRREKKSSDPVTYATLDDNTIEEACTTIRSFFSRSSSRPLDEVVGLLESGLQLRRDRWTNLLVRRLADTLLECRQARGISFRHEFRWLNLTGFCLRPGFGDPLDNWRMTETWKLFAKGLHFPGKAQGPTEWWIFWRRVAGGLSAGQQLNIYHNVKPGLKVSGQTRRTVKPWRGQEELEVWMMLANLERLPAKIKEELGEQLVQSILKGNFKAQHLWALGRFGARIPFYGPLDKVISSRAAAAWVDSLLSLSSPITAALAHMLIQLTRFTGDRERDVPVEQRQRVARRIDELSSRNNLLRLLLEPEASCGKEEQDQIFGESLPPGLILSQ